jgi:hypothetical protein
MTLGSRPRGRRLTSKDKTGHGERTFEELEEQGYVVADGVPPVRGANPGVSSARKCLRT